MTIAMEEKLITTREVSVILGISEKDVMDLADTGRLSHFKVAGEFLRFRREDVLKVKHSVKRKQSFTPAKYKKIDKVKEWIYFNDFYIVCTAIIAVLLWVIFSDFYQ